MKITIKPINSVFLHIDADQSILMELDDAFKFLIPNAKFHPLVKNHIWDGYIHEFNIKKQTLHYGLLAELKLFAENRDYEVIDLTDLPKPTEMKYLVDFCKNIGLPKEYEVRDYQLDAVLDCLNNTRRIVLSPTNSGKSLIMYLIHRYMDQLDGVKTLIIVPTTTLVDQLAGDFKNYGYQEDKIYGIRGGVDKTIPENVRVVVSTWQSLHDQTTKWFNQFNIVMGDECHYYKSKSLVTIMEKCTDVWYKFGFTGSLDESATHKTVLTGLYGPVITTTTNREMIDRGFSSDIKVNILCLEYSDETRKQAAKAKLKYPDEIKFIELHEGRNKFVTDLALSLKGNILILFDHEEHGLELHRILKEVRPDTVFINGKVKTDYRNEARAIMEQSNNIIFVCSFGTFSTGISIKKMHHIIFASPFKAKIRQLQSVGRGLRTHASKIILNLWDIADDLRWKSSYTNHTFKHLIIRIKQYAAEQFNFKIITRKIEK